MESSSDYMGKRSKHIMVSGGAGFVGSNLCERLLKDGHRVVCIDNLYTGSLNNIQEFLSNEAFEFRQMDICNIDNQEGRAELDKDGRVVWPREDLCRQYSAVSENIVCNHCKHFPICGGPCPVQRNAMLRNKGEVSCLFGDDALAEGHMREEVLRYCREQVKVEGESLC